jgi:hydrogenase 3 maturation protease
MKTLNISYKEQLNQVLTNHLANNSTKPRLAIVGIGNELNGDDAAGVLAVGHLQRLLKGFDSLLMINASVAPENFTGQLRLFQPDWVWLLDAAEMGENPGKICLLDWQEAQGVSAITHGLPPTLFARFVMQEFGAHIFLFGIQPAMVDLYAEPTSVIQEAVLSLAETLSGWIRENYL